MLNTPLREKTIAVVSSRYGGDGSVRISQYADYFELEISRCYADLPVFKSMSHDEARALRDALIELYPLVGAAAPLPAYTAEPAYDDDWEVLFHTVEPSIRVVAKCPDQDSADRIATALNAKEHHS